MKRVFVQGTYDILNAGHVRSLNELATLGTVIVGLNSDKLVREHKKREPIIPFSQRREILLGLKAVSEVIECDNPLALEYLKILGIEIFASVPEWLERQKDAIDWIEKKGGYCHHLIYYPDIDDTLSSTMIRERVIKGAE
jgi:glycerol-3-phosphate cytidylyltransferase